MRRAAVRTAREEGKMPATRIAETLGCTRSFIYKLLQTAETATHLTEWKETSDD